MRDTEYETYLIRYKKGKAWSGERFLDTQIKTEFIIDAHTHPVNDHSGEPFTDEQRSYFKDRFGYWIPFEATPEEQIEIMRHENISKAIIFDAGTPTLEEAWKVNCWIAEVTKKHHELLGFAFAPSDGSEGTEELIERSVNQLKLKGIGEIFPTEKMKGLEVIFETATQLEVPVVLANYNWDQHYKWLRETLPSFAKLKLILPHLGHGFPEMISIINDFKNVYADISMEIHYYEARAAKIIKEIGPEKFLFGSDFPGTCWTPHDDIIRTERLPPS